jgi:hypothetical protein
MPRAEREKLPDVASHLLEECRMVLPGIQALFGFQLVAVFTDGFEKNLSPHERVLHLVAIGLVAIAVALVMTPAAYHRQSNPEVVSHRFVRIASTLLLWSMLPLSLAICLDFYLIARVILHDALLSGFLTGALFLIFVILWFVLPRINPQPQPDS